LHRLPVVLVSLLFGLATVACAASASSSAPSPAPPSSSPSVAAPSASATAAATEAASPSAGGQTIVLSEWKVDIASPVKAGTTNFSITNNGTAPHELLVFKSNLEPAAYPTDSAGDITEDGPGVTLVSDGENIDPGGSQDRTVDLTPGTYLFVCNIAGHFKQGMFTVVTVAP
jgi:uncharacterized cupredoxin-like copper-binding protein